MSRMSLSLLALLIFLLSPLGFMTSPVFAAEAPYVDAASADSDEDVYAGESEMDAASADDDEDAQAYADLYAQMMQQQSLDKVRAKLKKKLLLSSKAKFLLHISHPPRTANLMR